MKYKIRRSEDLETVREAHQLAFPADPWPGGDHEFWLAYDEMERVVGFASALYWEDLKCVFLSRAAVVTKANGGGLQRRLIRVRVRWARSIKGCQFVWSYVARWNYASLYNLMRSGFTATKKTKWGIAWHVLVMRIGDRRRSPITRFLNRVNPDR